MKEYKKYVLGGVFACFMAVALMAPAGKSEAFWPFGKVKKENNANYTGAVANTEGNKAKPAPSVTVVYPNGGETLQGGKPYTIKWKSKGISKKERVEITLLIDPENEDEVGMGMIISSSTPNSGSYKWKVPINIKSNRLSKIKLWSLSAYKTDESDRYFSIVQKTENKKLKVTDGEQIQASLFPKGSILPFTNFIVDPQGKEIALDQVMVLGNNVPFDGSFEIMLVVKKFNSGEKLVDDFYKDKTIARGAFENGGIARLVPSITTFAFNQPVEFSIVGVSEPGAYGLVDKNVLSMSVVSVEATNLSSRERLIADGLSIKGASHTTNNSLRVGDVVYSSLTNLGYLQINVPADSPDKALLKSLYLVFESNWETKDTIVTIKNNHNDIKVSFVCGGIVNGMVKCSFDKQGILMEKGSSFDITVNQNGGIRSFLSWFDLIVDGYAYEYRLYPQTGKACFLAGTKIDIANGSQKNIEEIKIGDYVKSLNVETRKTNNAKVVKVIKKIDPSRLTLNNSLKTVPDQKMFTKEGFKQAQDLKIGDYLLNNDNNWVKVFDISPVVYEKVETYDLVLDGGNTFYADGYLAHSVEE